MISFSRMDNRRLQQLIERAATIIEGQLGYWHVRYEDRDLWIITDESHNRMRVMTPVVEDSELQEQDWRLLLEANFDRALDAKYALSQGCLWSVFTHPLGELTEGQFLDALAQVKTLADNYGTSYSSSDLVFGGD